MLTALSGDNFNTLSLTTAINMLPRIPTRLGDLGIFAEKGIADLIALVENKEGQLSLLPTAPRGTQTSQMKVEARRTRAFKIPHIPVNDAVLADSVQGVRAFGSEDTREAVAAVVTDKLQSMKNSMDTTMEHLRVGAVKGNVLDADGTSVIYNLFSEFGIGELTMPFDFTAGVNDMKLLAQGIVRAIRLALGATGYKLVRALCSDAFWDAFITHPGVSQSYIRFQENAFNRSLQLDGGFEWCGIYWENYVGKIGTIEFIPNGDARFYAEGVPDLFQMIFGPANFNETVNTIGKPYYAKQVEMELGIGHKLHAQSNPLPICTRPGTLVRGFDVNGPSA